MQGNWVEAPHLAEDVYNLEDALVVAQWLNVFLRKSHVLKIACVAQIVNVISWLQTRGDQLLKQPSFYVFKLASNFATELGIGELNEDHWKVINFMRKVYQEDGDAPSIRRLTKESGVDTKSLYKLFPKGPAKKAAKIAGLPKPKGCI